MNRSARLLGAFALGAGIGLAWGVQRQRRRLSFHGRTVLLTGGSRGLGLVLARQLADEGARLVLLARSQDELQRAEAELSARGADVLTIPCDLRNQDHVNAAVEHAVSRFGGVDVLINNAGIIQVGPLDNMTLQDFEDALAIHLYAPLFCTMAVLPHMRRSRGGRIVNITSVGGKIAIPHLLPYTASKFALVGLSDGLRAELRRDNIFVTTVCPGLMRTGSPRNALFKGRHQREYAWFAIGDSLPLLSVSAERAAHQIIEACRCGAARLIIGPHIRAAVLINELFPGAAATLSALANRLLPAPNPDDGTQTWLGSESQSRLAPSWVTKLTDKAALKNNETG